MAKKNKPLYYAVRTGRNPGIYKSWDECADQVLHYSGARYKGFNILEEAQRFLVKPVEPVTPAVSATDLGVYDDKQSTAQATQYSDKPNQPQPIQIKPSQPLKRKESSPEVQIVPKKLKVEPTQPPKPEPPKELPRAGIYGNKAVVYTDGACTGNGKGHAQAGCGVYWGGGSPDNLAEKVPGPNQTNNRGEMMAVIRALERCPSNIKVLNIYSDSEYTINCLTKWRAAYEKRNFASSTNKKELIKNVDMIKYLYALFDNHTAAIKMNWVKGHNKHPDNEAADELAVAGARLPLVPQDVDWESLAILQSSSADLSD